MKKYTFKDFLAGKVDVRCVNDEQKEAFLKVCAKHGLLWQGGNKADTWLPPGDIITMKGFDNGRLGQSSRQFAAHCVCFGEIDLSPAPCYQITIDCDGDTTTAKMLVNGKEVKTATAKRNPADKANWRIGAQTAFDRLWKQQEKPKEKKNGVFEVGDRVVCIDDKRHFGMLLCGKHGRVVVVDEDALPIGVEFDEEISGHNCNGKAKERNGWYLRASELCHEKPTNQQVREVKRPAKKGEWVKIVNRYGFFDERYKNGDILRVERANGDGYARLSCGGCGAASGEYVVLEGYKP